MRRPRADRSPVTVRELAQLRDRRRRLSAAALIALEALVAAAIVACQAAHCRLAAALLAASLVALGVQVWASHSAHRARRTLRSGRPR